MCSEVNFLFYFLSYNYLHIYLYLLGYSQSVFYMCIYNCIYFYLAICFYLFLRVFLGQFYVHREIKKVQRFPIYLAPRMHSLLHYQHLPLRQSGTFVATEEPTPTHHNHPKFIVHRFTAGVVPSMGLDKCTVTCIHHYSSIQCSHCSKNLLCSTYSSLLSRIHISCIFPSITFPSIRPNDGYVVCYPGNALQVTKRVFYLWILRVLLF